MKKRLLFILFNFVMFCLSGIAHAEMKISSDSIKNGNIGSEHACLEMGGGNKSPNISVSGLPSGTKSIAIIIDDPDAKPIAGEIWVHWNVFNIPITGDNYSVSIGKNPNGIFGKQSLGGNSYDGMCPPNGKHTYRFAVFALKENVKAKTSGYSGIAYTIDRFQKDFANAILEKVIITGDYK